MKYLLSFILFFITFVQFAQSDLHCAADIIMKKYYESHPDIELQKRIRDINRVNVKNKSINSASFTIPLVFHVLHMGGPENISDAQVKDAVNILNKDFAKQNADTAFIIPEFKHVADSTKIQFALATKDPSGNCTNGIIHYYDTDTDWNEMSPTLYQYTWDPTKYLNVYIVRTITLNSGFGASGYTYFPGTLTTGSQADAIVVLNNYFGSIGTGNAFLSRVLTHEVGHWLGLYHVFGYSNGAGIDCSGDDFVTDTPPTPGYLSCPNAANPLSYQLCNAGVSENYQNYMDYSYCVKMFTQEQAYVMQNTLLSNVSGRDNLHTTSNLLSTGVISPNITCTPLADFKYNRTETCVGIPVTFTDASNNAIATSFNWSFPGGTPSTSTLSAPSVTYNAPGLYSVTYTSGSSVGSSLPITKSNIISVINNVASFGSNFFEGFEILPLPNNNWTVNNTSGGANWEQSFDAAYSGSASAILPSINNTRLSSASLVSPIINIASLTAPVLMFKLAAAESNSSHINNLKVFTSTDCENTWTQVYSKTGTILLTSPSTINPFIPQSLSEWRNEIISLASVSGSNHLKFKFTYTRDTISGANNVFIDDINISNSTNLNYVTQNLNFNVFPNPANEMVTIELNQQPFSKIFISNLLGQTIEEINETKLNKDSFTFLVGKNTKYTSGIYFINIESEGLLITKKLIIN